MTVKWTFPERLGALLICEAVKQKGHSNLKGWKIINAGKEKLKLSEEEVKKYEKTKDQKTKKPYDLDEQFIKFLRDKVKELDAKNMIPSALLPLVETLGLE